MSHFQGAVSGMFGPLRSSQLSPPADPTLFASLQAALEGKPIAAAATESTIRADTIRESRGDLLKEAA